MLLRRRMSRRVLLIVEDDTLAELLLEALADAGHRAARVSGDAALVAAVQRDPFDAAIVDLDTRARDGAATARLLRALAPATTVIALLPCGGLPARDAIPYDASVEKPARLRALLSALAICKSGPR